MLKYYPTTNFCKQAILNIIANKSTIQKKGDHKLHKFFTQCSAAEPDPLPSIPPPGLGHLLTPVKRKGLKYINWVKPICQPQRGLLGTVTCGRCVRGPLRNSMFSLGYMMRQHKKRMMLLCKNMPK